MVKACETCQRWGKYPTHSNWGICESEAFREAFGKKGKPASHKTYGCKFWLYYKTKVGA